VSSTPHCSHSFFFSQGISSENSRKVFWNGGMYILALARDKIFPFPDCLVWRHPVRVAESCVRSFYSVAALFKYEVLSEKLSNFCGKLVLHYCFSWSLSDEGGNAAWASYTFYTLRFPLCHRYEREFETIKLLEGSGTMWTSCIILTLSYKRKTIKFYYHPPFFPAAISLLGNTVLSI
jgi:hypothetical protein